MSRPLIDITYKSALLFALFVVMYEFSTYVANDMIMPGMLSVIKEFNAPETALASSLTAYILGGGSLQLFIGPLSDRFGRRPVMLIGVIIFLAFTVLLVCANSIHSFIAARYFQGMGMCFIFVVGYASIQEIFEEMQAVRITSMMANVALIAPLIGPLLGAIIIEYFNWRMIFIVIGILAVTALIGLWKTMPETVGSTLSNGKTIPRVPLHPRVIFQNYVNLFKNSGFIIGTISVGFAWMPLIAWIAISPLILVSFGHLTVLDYGLWQIPVFIAIIIGNLILHKLTHHLSLKQILNLGSGIATISLFIGSILAWLLHGHYIAIIIGLTLNGIGMGICNGAINRLVLFSTEVAKGTASALMNIITMVIMAGGTELSNWVYDHHSNLSFSLYCLISVVLFYLLVHSVKHQWQDQKN